MTRFLVDAHLPRRLAHAMKQGGFDAVHTLDLPNGNRTSDAEINLISLDEQRVVVTKDADFVESLVLQGVPFKLLLISTGNIDNHELLQLFEMNLREIDTLFASYTYIELSRHHLVVHQ